MCITKPKHFELAESTNLPPHLSIHCLEVHHFLLLFNFFFRSSHNQQTLIWYALQDNFSHTKAGKEEKHFPNCLCALAFTLCSRLRLNPTKCKSPNNNILNSVPPSATCTSNSSSHQTMVRKQTCTSQFNLSYNYKTVVRKRLTWGCSWWRWRRGLQLAVYLAY